MKKLFTAIRQKDFEAVKALLDKKPELIACTAKQPPKKDDGQSPLQVALKTGSFDVADYLLDLGADVNFIEAEDCCNAWRAPVLHDAINAAVMTCRWNVAKNIHGEFQVFSTKEEADRAFGILKRMLEMGADVNAVDSYGNTAIWRLCLQARQILPSYSYSEHKMGTDRILTPELMNDLARIFALIAQYGADLEYIRPNIQKTVKDDFKEEPVGQFLKGIS